MDTQELRKQLPNGAISEISKRTGVNKTTVSMVLRGKAKSRKYQDILKVTAEYLTEYKDKENESLQAISEALKRK